VWGRWGVRTVRWCVGAGGSWGILGSPGWWRCWRSTTTCSRGGRQGW
jgi:hypothetical protein